MYKFMLDTNICIYTIKNRPAHVRDSFNLHQEQVCVSTVTVMELIYGAEKSSVPEKNLAVVESYVARLTVMDYNHRAAEHTGQLRAELQKQGKPIGRI